MSEEPRSNGVESVEQAVKRCYSTWGESYYREYYGKDAPYPPVHLQLITSLVESISPRRLLDAGCGPASMLRHLVKPAREVYGFDLTPEMVDEARRILGELEVAPQRIWQGSVLDAAAFACPGETPAPFDAVYDSRSKRSDPAPEAFTVLSMTGDVLSPLSTPKLEPYALDPSCASESKSNQRTTPGADFRTSKSDALVAGGEAPGAAATLDTSSAAAKLLLNAAMFECSRVFASGTVRSISLV